MGFNNNKKRHNNQNNKGNNKRPSFIDQNRVKFESGEITPRDISNNTDKIIRDLVYGNINIDTDGHILCNPTVFTSIYNRVLFLYQYNWCLDVSLANYIQANQYMELAPIFFQAQSVVKPKAEGYRILLDILETFRLTSNIQLIRNIPLSLKQYRNCL